MQPSGGGSVVVTFSRPKSPVKATKSNGLATASRLISSKAQSHAARLSVISTTFARSCCGVWFLRGLPESKICESVICTKVNDSLSASFLSAPALAPAKQVRSARQQQRRSDFRRTGERKVIRHVH